jgi:hypothetical protein
LAAVTIPQRRRPGRRPGSRRAAGGGVQLAAAPAAEFARRAQAIFRKNLLLAAETCRLQELLDAEEIPSVALKGVALAQLAYGSLKVKHTRDIGLLIPPDRALAAMALLERDGYALSFPANQLSAAQRRAVVRYSREVAFIHPDHGALLELQWRVADNPKLLNEVHAGSPTQNVVVADGSSVRTLARDDLFAYLCLHGAYHAWSRLKWLADLNAFIAAADVAHLHRAMPRPRVPDSVPVRRSCFASASSLCRFPTGLRPNCKEPRGSENSTR